MNFNNRDSAVCLCVCYSDAKMFSLYLIVVDGVYISLTENSLSFCKAGLTFLEDLLKLNQTSVQYLVDDGLQKMWTSQITHIENSLNSLVNIKEVSLTSF